MRTRWMTIVLALAALAGSQTACEMDLTGVGEAMCAMVASGTRHFPNEQPKAGECSSRSTAPSRSPGY